MTNEQENDKDEVIPWELPFVGEEKSPGEAETTNALNRRANWQYEPPEEEVEILPPTAEEIEAIRAAAHAEGLTLGRNEGQAQGYEQGFAEGKEAGLAQGIEEGTAQGLSSGEEQSKQHLAHWIQLIDSLHKPIEKVDDELEKELVLLAVSLARGVIRSEVKTNSDLIFQALREGLKALPIQEKCYQIHLNPDDIIMIKDHFSEDEIAKHNWQLVEAPQLSAGGCEIVTQSNAVDISVERRVKDVLDKFLLEQGLAHAGSGEA
ncbi:flagellar assembly protein FliH [Paraglaciecola aquimarina]|uniref:Flagellar assembly protein FliH n=1 Tax=Paraglaciecola aquimarina TaxID=1235557 RepID=A0ABU3T0B0_9ALTE|nr:flagellar assembly protein FliH [Paraglaciecola aquimarina]MDU0355693.1 flagellar assembly protein FliH [Paraglaciecola aquimarina]